MALRDSLASEVADDRTAAAAAAAGRSITGFSGRHTDAGNRFANHTDAFGPQVEPLIGDRVRAMSPAPMDGEGFADAALPQRVPAPPTETRERKPFGMQEQTLAYPSRPGFRRYWANDKPGRIQRFREAGYDHVRDDQGQPIARITGTIDGRGQSSYLMEIPNHWYQEDMARQAAELDARLGQIKRGQAGPGAEDNRYIPEQGIRIQGR